METELSVSLAEEIASRHAKAEAASREARSNIDAALHAAADVGVLIDKAKETYKGRLHDWLRHYVPTLPVAQADIYYGIHKVRSKRECMEADTRQLKLLGITGEAEAGGQVEQAGTQRADGSKWVKWTSHIVQHFREVEESRRLEDWESYERRALADTLLPIVALFKRAGGVL